MTMTIMTKEIKNFIISGLISTAGIMFISVLFLLMIVYPIRLVYYVSLLPLIFFTWSCYFSGVGMTNMGKEKNKPYNKQAIVFILGILTMGIEFGILIINNII